MTPLMAEHCLKEVDLDPSAEFNIGNEEMVDKIIKAALFCKELVNNLETMETIPGYIIYEEVPETEDNKDEDLLTKNKNQKKEQNQENKQNEQNDQRETLEKELK